MTFRKLDVTLHFSERTQHDTEKKVCEVVAELVDDWGRVDPATLKVKRVTGGFTNILFRVTRPHNHEHVLVRIFGHKTELVVDRNAEFKRFEVLFEAGFGPKLYGAFENGYVYGHFDGRTVTPQELKDGHFNTRVASQLARWHKTDFPGEKRPALFSAIRKWLDLIPNEYEDPVKNAKFKKLDFAEVKREMVRLEEELSTVHSPIVYCHNDLLSYNMIYDESHDVLHFIDYEYASYNPRAFDIANHFCEFAGFDLDYSQFPSREQQYEFYRAYLSTFNDAEPTEQQIDDMFHEVNKFVLASHSFWASWALLQGTFSDIEGLDYVQYGVDRFKVVLESRKQGKVVFYVPH
eukprot:TRINITY_DN6821_c0_g1_i1.p1 TRINITY_DN6821_c0_g1~~TRINITY_DN6821_c0_g1_i1.p1  ORF type:complete len:349 (-),score=54.50 TRINITY_DN6821_c0_g1_i1:66-1112(-)